VSGTTGAWTGAAGAAGPARAEQPLREATAAARRASQHPLVEALARLGYAVRGALYLVVGALAVQLAAGAGGGAAETQLGAIETIGRQPFGRALLVLVAIGLAGYGLWGLVRAAVDPFGGEPGPAGLARRAGYLVSGGAYGALVPPTVLLILGAGPGGAPGAGGDASAWVARALAAPGGAWLVGGAGVVWILGGGLGQLVRAYRADFRREFAAGRMAPAERRWATRVGRLGLAARGVVFALVGGFLVRAAAAGDAGRARGLDGALQALAAAPHGAALLALVAAGLVCFGAYSLLCARWVRIP
jgi:hypothetical protein